MATRISWTVIWRDNLDRTKYETFDNKVDAIKCVLKHQDSILHFKECHYLDVLETIASNGV